MSLLLLPLPLLAHNLIATPDVGDAALLLRPRGHHNISCGGEESLTKGKGKKT